ncbi:MAG: DUF465 domain-containing protein [Desulfovibrio sp.]|nr:MAG: DUF465 domain-containing protein [Desulfovibrio sp.]
MEQRDLELVEKYAAQDAELKTLWEEHLLYEKQLEKLEKKSFLSSEEQRVVKDIKKKKLGGKTRLQAILDRYRSMEE